LKIEANVDEGYEFEAEKDYLNQVEAVLTMEAKEE
jgi:hypothetical protein